ncbi:MAG TPA: LuxR C-terminal-related transcriptional regulator, partial [Mycobacterium sp.]
HIVHTLAEGGLVFSPMIGSKIAAGYLSGMGDPNARRIVGRLSVREVDVVRLLARGRNNAEIAKTLYIGVGTVKDHVRSILAKLSVTSRVEAAVIAQRSGILERRDQ